MTKLSVYLPYLSRLGLQILGLEVAFLAFSWLLNRYWNILQRFSFADVLFFMGTLAILTGSVGMMHSPYWVPLSPAGVWASQIQEASEEGRRAQLIDESMHQTSFGLRILAVGVITFLLSIVLTYAQ